MSCKFPQLTIVCFLLETLVVVRRMDLATFSLSSNRSRAEEEHSSATTITATTTQAVATQTTTATVATRTVEVPPVTPDTSHVRATIVLAVDVSRLRMPPCRQLRKLFHANKRKK
jgi:hypothetical protein